MTPERNEWWDKLSAKERELYVALDSSRRMLKLIKIELTACKGNACLVRQVRRQKLVIKAIKHELDRTTVAAYTGHYKEAIPIYRCEKCGGTFEDFEQPHCCWCGRKIVGRK